MSARPPRLRVVHTAEASVRGGREDGHGTTPDGELDLDLEAPGEGVGTNPEQLFAVAYAACFAESIRTAGRRADVDVDDVSIDSRVTLLGIGDHACTVRAALDITLAGVEDAEAAERVVCDAHAICPWSNATRGNVDVALVVNGRRVGGAAAA